MTKSITNGVTILLSIFVFNGMAYAANSTATEILTIKNQDKVYGAPEALEALKKLYKK